MLPALSQDCPSGPQTCQPAAQQEQGHSETTVQCENLLSLSLSSPLPLSLTHFPSSPLCSRKLLILAWLHSLSVVTTNTTPCVALPTTLPRKQPAASLY